MLEIAGGIVLALVFLSLLPMLIILAVWLLPFAMMLVGWFVAWVGTVHNESMLVGVGLIATVLGLIWIVGRVKE